jgi:hypothetical protein
MEILNLPLNFCKRLTVNLTEQFHLPLEHTRQSVSVKIQKVKTRNLRTYHTNRKINPSLVPSKDLINELYTYCNINSISIIIETRAE